MFENTSTAELQKILQSIERIVGSAVAGALVLYLLRYFFNRFMSSIEERFKALNEKDKDLKDEDDKQWTAIGNIEEKLNTLQGEHNAKSCEKE